MPAASRPSHAPFSALLPAPASALFSAQGRLERETHPRRDPLRGLPAPALSRLPARLQLAGVHGRPSSEGGGTSRGGGRAARWARGPGGRRAAQRPAARAAPAGRLCSRRASRVRRASSPPPLGRVLGIRNNVELAARAPSVASLAPLALSLTHRAPASPSSPRDVRQRGGVRVNPLLTRPPGPRQAQPPPNCTHLPSSGGVRPQARAVGSSSGPLAQEMPLPSPFSPPEGGRATCPPLQLTKGGSDL